MLLLKLVLSRPTALVRNVDVVVDVVVEVGAVKAFTGCKKMVASSLMLLIKANRVDVVVDVVVEVGVPRPTAFCRKC